MADANPAVSTFAKFVESLNLREIVTALLSLGIAGVALYLLLDTYAVGRSSMTDAQGQVAPRLKEAFDRQKDILLIALGLLGTVTGYYLGRAPAERQADAARDVARKAEASEAKVKQEVRTAAAEIRNASAGAAGMAAAGAGAPNPVDREVDRLLQAIS